jgi:hypothetical protein
MSEPGSLIMLQFLAWVADRPRSYPETMEAWRKQAIPHRHPPCALSKISVWRDGALYPLVRGCRAPRRMSWPMSPIPTKKTPGRPWLRRLNPPPNSAALTMSYYDSPVLSLSRFIRRGSGPPVKNFLPIAVGGDDGARAVGATDDDERCCCRLHRVGAAVAGRRRRVLFSRLVGAAVSAVCTL